ncbi:MAG: hypothetical protein DYH12_16000 [Sorangiineae bacterium PRO1]|nr:hypothetical protein [Sorangiineae bacterium PRO1]
MPLRAVGVALGHQLGELRLAERAPRRVGRLALQPLEVCAEIVLALLELGDLVVAAGLLARAPRRLHRGEVPLHALLALRIDLARSLRSDADQAHALLALGSHARNDPQKRCERDSAHHLPRV